MCRGAFPCVRAGGHILQRRTVNHSPSEGPGENPRGIPAECLSEFFSALPGVSPHLSKLPRGPIRPIPESADSVFAQAVGVIRAACSADRRAPMRTGIIRAPATPVVAAEARPFVMELSTSIFTHPSIVPMCVSLSVVCCLILWCMRCDWFKSRRKAESKPLLSCGDGSDPWEAEDLIVQIGVPAREFVRISTIPPCSGVWKGSIELRACS